MKRNTIKNSVQLSGIGLFSAQPVAITISPRKNPGAPGIYFQHNQSEIHAHIDQLSNIPVHPAFAQMPARNTSIRDERYNIATIEHILSAFTGISITDATIKINSQINTKPSSALPTFEIPILDGSSIEFINAIQTVGLETLEQEINPIIITKTIRVESQGSSITIEPSDTNDTISYSYTLDYSSQSSSSASESPIPSSTVYWTGDHETYINTIAPARTFCLKHEADAMHSAGLFTHLTPKDMLVIGEHGPIENQYRHPDECAYHKLLDLIGDLSLVARPIIGRITAIKSGHAMAHQAAALIVEQSQQ